jgi:hypothetical protein
MKLNIDMSNIPSPKEVNFKNVIGMLLRTNRSIFIMKTEIFMKIRMNVKNVIFLLIEND